VLLLRVLAVGFATYTLWRLSQAAFGTAADGNKTGPRIQSLVRGLIYAGLCASTVSFIAGRSRQGQAQQQQTATAKLMRHTTGRVLVALVGIVVVAVGVGMNAEGARKSSRNNCA
jgi:hypothetical protein